MSLIERHNLRHLGYKHDVSVYAYYKVAMAKTTDECEIEDQAFLATDRLFEHFSEVKVINTEVQEVHQEDKYFTVADVGLELRVRVTAHDYEEAYEEAEGLIRENMDLPGGVAFFECEAFDYEVDAESIFNV